MRQTHATASRFVDNTRNVILIDDENFQRTGDT
jgi:hypothetical protein